MLPSTGLFKSIACPYYDSQKSCTRPYCHFKHAKKDEENQEIPVYIPTPKVLPKLLTLDSSPVKKKSKLEYVPTQPGINDKIRYESKPNDVPVYIPSNKVTQNGDEEKEGSKDIDLDDCSEELDLITDIVAKFSEDEEIKEEYDKEEDMLLEDNKSNSGGKDDVPVNNVICENGEKNENATLEGDKNTIKQSLKTKEKEVKKQNSVSRSSDRVDAKKSKSRHHNSHSSSSSQEHKKHRAKHKSSSDKESKDKNKHKEKASTHSSSSKSSKKASSKSHSHRHIPSSSSSSKHKSRSSHKPKNLNSREKSNLESEKSSESKAENLFKESSPLHAHLSEAIADSDEDDVLEQCKQIFEEFKNTQKSNEPKNITKEIDSKQKRKSFDSVDENPQDDNKRKRIAHEGATATGKNFEVPIIKKINHVQNAYQSVYNRQEQLRKEKKETEAAALALVKEAEEKLREAEENLRKATMAQKQTLTPLIPKIKPIVNYLALEKAKKKVDEMRKLKGPTLAQSVAKGESRKAHNPKTTATVTGSKSNSEEVQNQPAPPVLEPNSTKISYNIRMQHYNQMVKYCLDIYPKCEDAWERAQTEELTVFKKCSTPIIYRSSAVLAINKLRKESIAAGNVCTERNKTVSHEVILAGKFASNVSVNKKYSPANPFDRVSSEKVYEMISELCLNDEQLMKNGFPRPGAKRGTAIFHNIKPQTKAARENERICRRCSKTFNIAMYENEAIDECCYHPKGIGYRRGFTDNFHQCCQQPAGSTGCTYANYHVTEYTDLNNLKGFVQTIDKGKNYTSTKKDIFALDCEMCYTTEGIELTRVTVVNFEEKVVYDALVKPENKIIDYNTVFSGITEEMLRNEKRTIRDVQAILLSMFHSKTILIGHSLESDMKALKLIHSCIVDTSVLYPHKMGPPKKRALKNLCIENLKRIIQEDEGGHNSAEDAEVCIALVKHYLKIKIN
ncbi:RNA exonuclease 1 homolog isoform X2 [Condylostylus longicornis]|uniref:RNA exonuclease 1 homolog isoform X2 n=1 Tax=Condylostylus longicornis TaxID=2530218 RepID=UPI00244E28B4|nr:RNA exonuclease 1 homolog isoform X2 [Condylostylus longicornis]